MKVRDFLDKLLFKLGEGDLQYVATQLKSYFHTIQQDNFWIKQAEEILDSLKDVKANDNYTEDTRKLKIQEVKENLRTIISTIKEETNVESQLKTTIPEAPREEFQGLVDLQKGTISLTSKGGQGIINQSGKILLGSLVILALLFGVGYYFLNKGPKKVEITNCDCSKLYELRSNATNELKNNMSTTDSLNVEFNNLESIELNEERIEQKEKILEAIRTFRSRADSIKGLILPKIESLASRCPFQDCNVIINNIKN